MLDALGSSPDDVSTTVSGLVVPAAAMRAPPVAAEFSQPFPGSPELLQGQFDASPSPKQNGVVSRQPRHSAMPPEGMPPAVWKAPATKRFVPPPSPLSNAASA